MIEKESLNESQLLYPSYRLVPQISRLVVNYNSFIKAHIDELEAQYPEIERVGSPSLTRRLFGDPNAINEILKSGHYITSNISETIEDANKEHKEQFEQLISSFSEDNETLEVGPKDWIKYATALHRIYPSTVTDTGNGQQSAEAGEQHIHRMVQAFKSADRAKAMELLSDLLNWPIVGGIIFQAENLIAQNKPDHEAAACLFRIKDEDFFANEIYLNKQKELLFTKKEKKTCISLQATVAWNEDLKIDYELVMKLVNLLTVTLGIPDAMQEDKVMFLLIPLFERSETASLSTQFGPIGHLLGWIIYPLVCKQISSVALDQIRKSPKTIIELIVACYQYSNTIATELLNVIIREAVESSNPDLGPLDELCRTVPPIQGWMIEKVSQDKNKVTEDCYFDTQLNRIIMRLDSGRLRRKEAVYLSMKPSEEKSILFRPPKAMDHVYANVVSQRLREAYSLICDKYNRVRIQHYCKDITKALSKSCFNLMSLLEAEEWESNKENEKNKLAEHLNYECERLLNTHKNIYFADSLPLIEFTFDKQYTDEFGPTLGDCYCNLDDSPKQNPFPEYSEHAETVWALLKDFRFNVEKKNGILTELQLELSNEIGNLIRYDLPGILDAVLNNSLVGGRYMARPLHHELGKLLGHVNKCAHEIKVNDDSMSNWTVDQLKWGTELLNQKFQTITDEGKIEFGEHVIGECRPKLQVKHIQTIPGNIPGPYRIWGRKGAESAIILGKSINDQYRLSLSAVALEAIFSKLWKNAADMLAISCANKREEGKLSNRIVKLLEEAQPFGQRFEDMSEEDIPKPRRVVLIYHQDKYFYMSFLDNAPELVGEKFKIKYPEQSQVGHYGMSVVMNIVQTINTCLKPNDIIASSGYIPAANYAPAHSLSEESEDKCALLYEIIRENQEMEEKYKIDVAHNWSLAEVYLENKNV